MMTRRQAAYMRDLARRAGVEEPQVLWAHEARNAITRLERHIAATEFGSQLSLERELIR
jgi:hypothetical protein